MATEVNHFGGALMPVKQKSRQQLINSFLASDSPQNSISALTPTRLLHSLGANPGPIRPAQGINQPPARAEMAPTAPICGIRAPGSVLASQDTERPVHGPLRSLQVS
jgi:hypothetical protein